MVIGLLALASAGVVFLNRESARSPDTTLIDGPAQTPATRTPGAPPRGDAAPDRMIDKPWVMKRSGSANHAGHDPEAAARRLKALSRPGGLDSLDALLGIETDAGADDPGVSPGDEAAANRLLEILAGASLVGEGTREKPYLVSWELLDTARHSFRPHDGLNTIPPDVEKLDGKIVRLEGFFLAPFSLSDTDQLLLMRYTWDGCCIGVPPTAYSTVEVGLATPAGRRALAEARTLTVEGRFRIDPYESRGWLLSLYLMEEGRVVIED